MKVPWMLNCHECHSSVTSAIIGESTSMPLPLCGIAAFIQGSFFNIMFADKLSSTPMAQPRGKCRRSVINPTVNTQDMGFVCLDAMHPQNSWPDSLTWEMTSPNLMRKDGFFCKITVWSLPRIPLAKLHSNVILSKPSVVQSNHRLNEAAMDEVYVRWLQEASKK